MNRSDFDWTYVFRHTLLPSMCVVVGALTLCLAYWFQADHEKLYAELHATHDGVDKDYDALVKQRQLVDRYHRQYQRFHDLGFIGRESRLDWVETLRTTAEALSMPRLGYSIDPQLGVVAPVTSMLASENFDIRVSLLQLEMGLVHEIDLLRFFDALQKRAPGLIRVDQCSLEYVSDIDVSAVENLTASCAVQIFSVITSDVGGEMT